MENSEHLVWVEEYINGTRLQEIAAKYHVPFWRVRNAVFWSDKVATHTLTKYAKFVEPVRDMLKENPRVNVVHNPKRITPSIVRMIRYALILRGEIPNHTRHGKRITIQEETRIATLAKHTRDWRKLGKLCSTTGRSRHMEARIAERVLGTRITQYRRNAGISMRGIAEITGINYANLGLYIRKGIITVPYETEQFIDVLTRGFIMYACCNTLAPEFHDIGRYLRQKYRSMYISSQHIREITFYTVDAVHKEFRTIPRMQLYPHNRVLLYEREAVAQHVTKKHGARMGLQIREYDNDWAWLKTDWYTWG